METARQDAKIVTALFDTRDRAEAALQQLVAQGVPREHLSLHANRAPFAGTTEGSDSGLVTELLSMVLRDSHIGTYADAVRRGGVLLVAEVAAVQHDPTLDLLRQAQPAHLDSHPSAWRKDAWRAGDASGLPANAVPDTPVRDSPPLTRSGMRVSGAGGPLPSEASSVVATAALSQPADTPFATGADPFRERTVSAAAGAAEPATSGRSVARGGNKDTPSSPKSPRR